MSYPNDVPVLVATDIYRGKYDGPNDTHCLLGWCKGVFESEMNTDNRKILQAIRVAIDSYDLNPPVAAPLATGIACFNDNTRNSKSKIATVWNRAMAMLGYVKGNPQAKWLEKQI